MRYKSRAYYMDEEGIKQLAWLAKQQTLSPSSYLRLLIHKTFDETQSYENGDLSALLPQQ